MTSKIAVFFPGIGYHCDKPLMYYSRNIVREPGYQNYRNVNYTYKAENIRGNKEKIIGFIGTADPWSDTLKNLEILKDVMQKQTISARELIENLKLKSGQKKTNNVGTIQMVIAIL